MYEGGCPPRSGRTRRVPLAARKLESIAMRFPVARTKIRAEKKEAYTQCGEASTYQGTYCGVKFRKAAEMPLIPKAEKEKILKHACMDAPETWVDQHGPDQPLFWQESKPIAFFAEVLKEYRIKAVYDMTAGTGALMEACLGAGVLYHGLCPALSCSSALLRVCQVCACASLRLTI